MFLILEHSVFDFGDTVCVISLTVMMLVFLWQEPGPWQH